jgi:type I restriction-modification system DNA methylase subunit
VLQRGGNKGSENLIYKMSEFEFTTEYVPGERNNFADVLSRLVANYSESQDYSMISISDILKLIQEAHDMNLHHGFTKTFEALRGKVCPGKNKDFNDFFLSCSFCKEKNNRKTRL